MTAITRQSTLMPCLPKLPFGTTWAGLGFALRTTAASLIALYFALLMGFDDPKWAPMTVWIVAQGTRGTSLSKSQSRLAGTLIGAVVAIVLTALFSQQPEILLPGLAAWLGLCTALSTGLRNFRSYGAVLAGYTASIVAMDAVSDPQNIFDIAVARVVYIALGIVTEAMVAAIFAPREPAGEIRRRLNDLIHQTATIGVLACRGDKIADKVSLCFVNAMALDTAAEYVAAGSHEMKAGMGYLRRTIVSCLRQVSIARTLRSQLCGSVNPEEALVADVAILLQSLSAGLKTDPTDLAALRDRVLASQREIAATGSSQHFMRLHRLETLLDAVEQALRYASMLDKPGRSRSNIRFSFHIDQTAALLNGARAFVAVLGAAGFWYSTGWSSGAGFVTIVGVVIALFATRPNPINSGLGFLKGTLCATIAAGVYNFAIIPAITGFIPLALALGIAMTGAGLAMRHPRTAAPAASFAIFFLDLISPDNMTRADASAFFNGALALTMGIGIGTLAFGVIIPVDRTAVRRRLHLAVRSDLSRIGRRPQNWRLHEWMSRIADRLSLQSIASASSTKATQNDDIEPILSALSIGCASIELAQLSPDGKTHWDRSIDVVRKSLATLNFDDLALTADSAARELSMRSLTMPLEDRLVVLRAAAFVEEIGENAIGAKQLIQ